MSHLRNGALIALVAVAMALVVAPMAAADGGSGGETIQVSIPPTGTVACTATNGKALGTDPSLRDKDTVVCTVAGLTAAERVSVTVDSQDLGDVTADAHGGLKYRFTVPSALPVGAHKLTFTGQTSQATAVFAFQVVTNSGGPGPGGGSGNGGGPGPGGGGPGPGRLVFTGVYVLGPVLVGAALIGGGSLLTVAARRRRRHG